jgi:hypothetical protein
MPRSLARRTHLTGVAERSNNVDKEEDADDERYFQAFKKHVTEIDEIANIVLKGHLLIEGAIDRIVRYTFFHPDYVLDSRHNFERKVQIARAMSLNAHNWPDWDIVLAVNSLRNAVAHKHHSGRKTKIDRIRQLCLDRVKPETRSRYKESSDEEIIIFACARCDAFLSFIEEDVEHLRREINDMIAKHHAES